MSDPDSIDLYSPGLPDRLEPYPDPAAFLAAVKREGRPAPRVHIGPPVDIIDDPVRDVEPSPAYREAVDEWAQRIRDSAAAAHRLIRETDAARERDRYGEALVRAWAREKPHKRCCGPGDQHAAQPDPYAIAATLGRLDVEPWRFPSWGVLEYDQVHDEWRVELWRDHNDQAAGTVIIRRYAGRRTQDHPSRPPVGFISLNRYLQGGDAPDAPDVYVGPPSLEPEPPWTPASHARYMAAWRRLADTYAKARRRPAFARGGRIRPFPLKPVQDDQVDDVVYSVRHYGVMEPSPALVNLVAETGEALRQARRGRA